MPKTIARIPLLLLLTFLPALLIAQFSDTDKKAPVKRASNSVFVEVGNASLGFGIHYDRLLVRGPLLRLSARVGMPVVAFSQWSEYRLGRRGQAASLGLSMLLGKRNSMLEAGGHLSGFLVGYGDFLMPGTYLGYRYQPAEGGVMFRAGVSVNQYRDDIGRKYMFGIAGLSLGVTIPNGFKVMPEKMAREAKEEGETYRWRFVVGGGLRTTSLRQVGDDYVGGQAYGAWLHLNTETRKPGVFLRGGAEYILGKHFSLGLDAELNLSRLNFRTSYTEGGIWGSGNSTWGRYFVDAFQWMAPISLRFRTSSNPQFRMLGGFFLQQNLVARLTGYQTENSIRTIFRDVPPSEISGFYHLTGFRVEPGLLFGLGTRFEVGGQVFDADLRIGTTITKGWGTIDNRQRWFQLGVGYVFRK